MAVIEGGMDIEEVAEKSPEKIVKLQVDPSMGLMAHQARRIAAELQLPSGLIGQAAKCLMGFTKRSGNAMLPSLKSTRFVS